MSGRPGIDGEEPRHVGDGPRPRGDGTNQDTAEPRSVGMQITLKVWRQKNARERGCMVAYQATGILPEMSFLEMLDVVNEGLERRGEEPIAVDSDCREGICGACGLVINGVAHGPGKGTTTCQVYMRSFEPGQTITVEPWRAAALPVVKDLMVDRTALDRIIQAGGYVSTNTGAAPEANNLLVPADTAEEAMDAAACIGCGACVAACKNAAAMLFVGAKTKHFAVLPQGQPERWGRVGAMLAAARAAGFGNCSNEYECEAVCPKEISAGHIAFLNREHLRRRLKSR